MPGSIFLCNLVIAFQFIAKAIWMKNIMKTKSKRWFTEGILPNIRWQSTRGWRGETPSTSSEYTSPYRKKTCVKFQAKIVKKYQVLYYHTSNAGIGTSATTWWFQISHRLWKIWSLITQVTRTHIHFSIGYLLLGHSWVVRTGTSSLEGTLCHYHSFLHSNDALEKFRFTKKKFKTFMRYRKTV